MFINGFEHKQVTLWHVIARANSEMFRCISAEATDSAQTIKSQSISSLSVACMEYPLAEKQTIIVCKISIKSIMFMVVQYGTKTYDNYFR